MPAKADTTALVSAMPQRANGFVIGQHAALAGRLVRFAVGVLGIVVAVSWLRSSTANDKDNADGFKS